MSSDDRSVLEQQLASTQGTAEACRKAASTFITAIKALSEAAAVGDLRTIKRAKEKAQQSLSDLEASFGSLREFPFADHAYFSSGAYVRELLDAAARAGLRMLVQGERLYSPPFEIRLLENEPAVMVGKRRIDRLRPSVLVDEIGRLQAKPSRFKPEEFLDILYAAFVHAVGKSSSSDRRNVVQLVEIYELLTLLPGAAKDYSSDDFARDVYLLDRSGIAESKRSKGGKVQFIASSGTRSSRVLAVMGDDGIEQKYYAISFVDQA